MPAPAWQDPTWQHPVAPPPAAGAPPAGTAPGQTPPTTAPQSTVGGGFLGPGNTMNDPSRMTGWTNWMTSGGVNPGGWQTTGGTNQDFLGQFNGYMQGGANPTQVDPTSASNLFGAAQPYADQAYQAATRELDPQTQQQTAAFQQQMVNQGIAPGSAAYQQAQQQLSMQQNDAYNQARNSAQTTGLAAQAQGFGQGLSQSQLANTMAGQLLGANTSMYNQQLGGNSSLMNALLGGNSGIAQQIIGGQFGLQGANASAAASRANGMNSYNLGEDQLNNNMLLSLLGMGTGAQQYNNSLTGYDQGRNQSMYGGLPNANYGNIDAQSPYNNYYNGQNNQYGYNTQQANQQNAGYMAMLAALFGGG